MTFYVALVWLCYCQVYGVRVQVESISTQGSYHLRDGCRQWYFDDEHPRLYPKV